MVSTNLMRMNGPEPAPALEDVERRLTQTPFVDIAETDEELTVYADLPGVRPEDVELQLEKNELTLRARVAQGPTPGGRLLAEYVPADYTRTFTLGEEVDRDHVSAELSNGVLTLHLPKTARARPVRIAVQGG
jgi:HSP20 family protein